MILNKRIAEEEIRKAKPSFILLIKKKDRVVLFCKKSKRFFVMDKETFERVGKDYLVRNRAPQFKRWGNYFSYLGISITSKCNLACRYCLGKQSQRAGKIADFKTIKAAVDYIAGQRKSVEVIFISPGEHALESRLLERTLKYIGEKLKTSKMRVSFNGAINPKTYLRLRDYFNVFRISLDGPPEIQDLQRPMKGGGKSSKRVEATIRELKKNNKSLLVTAILTHNHIGKEERTFKYFFNLGLSDVLIDTVRDIGAGGFYYKKVKEGQLSKSQLKIKELGDEFGMRFKLLCDLQLRDKETGFCPVGHGFCLGIDGKISACTTYSDEKDLKIHPGMDKLIIGKFNKEKGIFEMDKKRIKWLREIHKKAPCYNCDFQLCWGGCPLRNLRYGKIERPYKKLCKDRKREMKEFLEYLLLRNVIKIKPCLSEKRSGLYYSMQFSEFPLVKCISEKIPLKSAFIFFNPAEANFKKMADKMILATKKNKGIVLFVLSPKYSNWLNREKSILFQEFLCSLKENKVLFKVSSPVRITAGSREEEKLFYKQFQIPQSCFECLEMFKLKAGRVVFCGGMKGPKKKDCFDREEIFHAFLKNNFSYNKPKNKYELKLIQTHHAF